MKRRVIVKHTALQVLCFLLLSVGAFGADRSAMQQSSVDEGISMFFPREIKDVLHNPHMGWVYIDNAIPGYMDAGRSLP